MIDTDLKPLNFRGRNLFYKLRLIDTDYGCSYVSDFYLTNNVTKRRKKFYLWGEIILIPNNKVEFTVRFNIESRNFSKKTVRKKLGEKVDLLDRSDELKKGEIV